MYSRHRAAVGALLFCAFTSSAWAAGVTGSLTASANPVQSGTAETVSWTSTNATSCTLQSNGGTPKTVAATGHISTGNFTTTTTYTLICTGTAGSSSPAVLTVTAVSGGSGTGAGTLALSAASYSVAAANGAITIPVNRAAGSTGAVSVGYGTANGSAQAGTDYTAAAGVLNWAAGDASAKSFVVTVSKSVTTAKNFTVAISSATGGATLGSPSSATVSITPAASSGSVTANLSASANPVAAGSAETVSWTSTNATSCTLQSNSGTPKTVAATGSVSTGNFTTTTTYTLICTGSAGSSSPAVLTVTVGSGDGTTQAPVVTLSANPTAVTSGATSVLNWSSSNAPTSCTASGGWTGTQAATGSTTTAPLTATTTYTLTCTNAQGSNAASVTVTVGSGSTTALAPKIAALTLNRSQQFAESLPGTATWTVNGIVGGNGTTGTVSSSGLYTAGSEPGQFTVTAVSSSDATKKATATVAVTDLPGVYSYHNNQSRNGANLQEYALTKANVAAGFGKLASCKVDGAVYAQPLWVANVNIGGAKHNVVYVATEHDGLFAFDADPVGGNCISLWSKNLIDSAHGANAGETTIPSGPAFHYVGVGAGDIQPEIGITGTPVIDPAAGILYVVTKSFGADKATYYQRLHAIDITTGNEKPGSPVVIAGTYTPAGGNTVTFNTHYHLQRAGLTFSNGTVYVAFTAHEDGNTWYGWMMSYQYADDEFTQKNVINVSPVSSKGGIWMSGGAPAVDASGNIYFLTGNGTFNVNTGGKDYGNSMMKLSPTLNVLGYYTPNSEPAQGIHDNDLGAGGAALLADLPAGSTVIHAMIFGGKESQLFVIDRDNPGGYDQSGNSHVQQIAFGTSIFATGALWNNHYYLAGKGGPLKAYTISAASGKPQFTAAGQSSNTYGFPGATPSLASAGAANGVAWTLDAGGKYCTNQSSGCAPVVLHAHDADTISNELWNSSKASGDAAGYPIKFNVPTVANGHVYIGTRGNDCSQSCGSGVTPSVLGAVEIYGLKP